MEGQFLVRQIYEDEITYNLIHAAVNVLRKFPLNFQVSRLNKYCNGFYQRVARQHFSKHGPTRNNNEAVFSMSFALSSGATTGY
jgi:hypothetical protein